eukprot:2529847-Pyramimonas_sp.AAC.1
MLPRGASGGAPSGARSDRGVRRDSGADWCSAEAPYSELVARVRYGVDRRSHCPGSRGLVR